MKQVTKLEINYTEKDLEKATQIKDTKIIEEKLNETIDLLNNLIKQLEKERT